MNRVYFIFLSLLPVCVFLSCDEPAEKMPLKAESAEEIPLPAELQKGFVGIYNVPEMLCLSRLDSGSMHEIPSKLRRNFEALESDLLTTGAERDGAAGQISYNNDTSNFVFESLVLIKNIPPRAPLRSKVVALESSKMLIYDYFGSYEKLYTGYSNVKKILTLKDLEQNGPMREFYIVDPSQEENPERWQTRIMIPVSEKEPD